MASSAPPLLIVGAGGAGLIAALAAAQAGAEVLVLDAVDPCVAGEVDESNTARSTGLIPAAGSALQAAAGIRGDSPECLVQDVLAANHGQCDVELLRAVCGAAPKVVDWLQAEVGVELECKQDFLYHGHSHFRMHGPPSGYGRAFVRSLAAKVAADTRIQTRCKTRVVGLLTDGSGAVRGVRLSDGEEVPGCAVVLATCGFGGSKRLVASHLGASLASAHYQGSPFDDGSGLEMGVAAGGELRHMSSYQGHATVTDATPPLLVTYGVVVNGGILVNSSGLRFGNEDVGYSEFSSAVLAQGPGVIEVFGIETAEACAATRLEQVIAEGQVHTHASLEALAADRGLPLDALRMTIQEVSRVACSTGVDAFGRAGLHEMSPPFSSIAVQAALFHTQGGLRVDDRARVMRAGGTEPVPGLFSAGGAAAGFSGDSVEGYLSGNGLLSAAVFGRWAGEEGARHFMSRSRL